MSPATDNRQCLERMCDVFNASEEWLVGRVTSRVDEDGLRRTPRSEEAWRESVRGISEAVFQAIYVLPLPRADHPHSDPIQALGILRARMHRHRGVEHADWLALFRVYRQAYLDLLDRAGFDERTLEICRDFVSAVFERFEHGFRQEYHLLDPTTE